MVVTATSLALSLLWVCIVFPFVLATVGAANYPAAVGIATFAFFTSLVVLQLCGAILLNIVDVVYICYACDKDSRAATRPDVHAIFEALPIHQAAAPGLLVEQPGGSVAYAPGAAAPGQAPPPYGGGGAEEGRGYPADPPPPAYGAYGAPAKL